MPTPGQHPRSSVSANASAICNSPVRTAVREFVARYNAEWLVEKNGYRSPAQMRAAWPEETFSRAA